MLDKVFAITDCISLIKDLRVGKGNSSRKNLAGNEKQKKLLSAYQGLTALIALHMFFSKQSICFCFNLPGYLF